MRRVAPRVIAAAWQAARGVATDIFAPGAPQALAQLASWSALGLADVDVGRDLTVSVLDALRAIALTHRGATDAATAGAQLVCTLPSADRAVLATADVASQLMEQARSQLLVVGYSLDDSRLMRTLAQRSAAGVDVTIVGDWSSKSALHLRRAWPGGVRPAHILENVEPVGGEAVMMHGKAIGADRKTALLGSANFTSGGLRRNIEFGVRVTGAVVADLVRTVERLEREGWLVPARM